MHAAHSVSVRARVQCSSSPSRHNRAAAPAVPPYSRLRIYSLSLQRAHDSYPALFPIRPRDLFCIRYISTFLVSTVCVRVCVPRAVCLLYTSFLFYLAGGCFIRLSGVFFCLGNLSPLGPLVITSICSDKFALCLGSMLSSFFFRKIYYCCECSSVSVLLYVLALKLCVCSVGRWALVWICLL